MDNYCNAKVKNGSVKEECAIENGVCYTFPLKNEEIAKLTCGF
jgi:hypothetical protein